ncbi:L-fucose:H+ symporter permease [Sphingomonas sp. IC-56]|uniref:L-fucose:H+ symporter permease n=1 Tax=Sphingomonas sp. IC-56 TaxID=2898529 RepID=UPI001E5C9847|nr:L-fucose:H+ symporter permease [Sphingomonas sp. IC-56]MCD2322936.1 L-fucose:H+ symporter permease [Sphingomonas sp. IC-56]
MSDTGRRSAVAGPLPLALIVALFFLWGVANNLNDVLIAHFKKLFTLGDFQAGLVQSAFYLGYFCLAIPAALFMRSYGYRAAVLLGLCLYASGALLFWPAAGAQSYPFFLVALFVIASGLAFLETSANPLIARLGSQDTASRRLNLAQAFNPLGSIAGVVLGSRFILSGVSVTPEQMAAMTPDALTTFRATEAAAVQMPYLLIGLGVLLWALLIRFTPFPAIATEREVEEGVGAAQDFGSVLRNPRVITGVAAQFFYVGAQVGIWSFLIRYAEVAVPGTTEHQAAGYLTLSLMLFMVGRFAGAALMSRLSPLPLLAGFAAMAGLLCVAATLTGGMMGLGALVASSFFMSIMYPTIFAESVHGLGPRTKSASALLVMAIVGGAVFPAIMGYVSDVSGSILNAMLVPALCFAVVVLFALRARRATA